MLAAESLAGDAATHDFDYADMMPAVDGAPRQLIAPFTQTRRYGGADEIRFGLQASRTGSPRPLKRCCHGVAAFAS